MTDNLSVGSFVLRRAARTPDRVAVIADGVSTTYRVLAVRVERLAAALWGAGVRPGDRVVLVLRNEPAVLETTFACGRIGAVAVPVHVDLDASARAAQVREAEPVVVVCAADVWVSLRRSGALDDVPVCVATGAAPSESASYERFLDAGGPAAPDVTVGLDDIGLWGHSSGTSGTSKAVALTHGNLLFNTFNVWASLDYVSTDVFLTSAPLHRMGAWGFLLPLLLKGGTCVLQSRADADESLRLIERHRATVVFDGVGAMQALADAWTRRDADVSSLRICLTGGTRVPAALGEAFRRRGLVLQPGYGLTEASPLVAVLDRADVAAHPDRVGRPALFTDVRVVDGVGRDVRAGEAGEIWIRGPHVTPGYVGRARGVGTHTSEGWFPTGDAGVLSTEGMLSVLGRVADALVIGGRVVHPEPIEDALRAEAGVTACVLVQQEANATPVLWVVSEDGAALDGERLRALAAAAFGGEPPALRTLDALPRNANGKPLRRALRALTAEAA